MPTSVHDDTEFVRHVYARLSTFIHRLQAAFNGEALLEIRGHTSLRKQLKILRVLRKSESQERVATDYSRLVYSQRPHRYCPLENKADNIESGDARV